MANILVVDDEPDMRQLVRSILESDGYTVETVEGGPEALGALKDFQPQLVVSDIKMDGMTGFQLLERMREQSVFLQVPFIFITGFSEREVFRHGMELGADDFIAKPFSKAELLASVRTRLRLRQVLREDNQRRLDQLRQDISFAMPDEFRTPLNAVLAFSRILSEDTTLGPEEGRKYARMIHTAGERLHGLVEDFLAIAQIEISSANPETLRQLRARSTPLIASIVRSCSADVAAAHSRVKDLRVAAEEGTCQIAHEHVSKLLTEVIDNAFKFSPRGTRVAVTGNAGEDRYTIEVRDQGIGMTADQVNDVDFFRPFGRKTDGHQGSGLGLSVARKFVELYRGTLAIETSRTDGTTVRILLPLATQ